VRVVITSNVSKVSARFQALARKMPEVKKRATRSLADEALELFDKTTETWTHGVQFDVIETPRGHTVQTDDPIYRYVDMGTPAHLIRARNVPLLRFMGPYHAKTKPNVIASYKGGRGRIWVSKRQVNHPGIEARNFRKIIFDRMQRKAANRLREFLREAAAGSGFGL
jgi:hypothetical protein